jgi:hypothetical protein
VTLRTTRVDLYRAFRMYPAPKITSLAKDSRDLDKACAP